jgi:hypothetical protein
LTGPRYTNGRACDLNSLQEIIHVSRLLFFTHSCTRIFFVSPLKERNYTYSMYLSTVKVGLKQLGRWSRIHLIRCRRRRGRSSEVPSPILASCRRPWKPRTSPCSQPSLSTSRSTWLRWPRTRRPRCSNSSTPSSRPRTFSACSTTWGKRTPRSRCALRHALEDALSEKRVEQLTHLFPCIGFARLCPVYSFLRAEPVLVNNQVPPESQEI